MLPADRLSLGNEVDLGDEVALGEEAPPPQKANFDRGERGL